MSVDDKDIQFVLNTLHECGWLKQPISIADVKKVSPASWTDLGESGIRGIFESLRLPDLTQNQQKALRWLAWQTYRPGSEPPPSVSGRKH